MLDMLRKEIHEYDEYLEEHPMHNKEFEEDNWTIEG